MLNFFLHSMIFYFVSVDIHGSILQGVHNSSIFQNLFSLKKRRKKIRTPIILKLNFDS